MRDRNKDHPLKHFAWYSTITTSLTGGVLLGIFGGRWIDQELSTKPLFMILGLFLGLGIGVYGTMATIRKYMGTGD